MHILTDLFTRYPPLAACRADIERAADILTDTFRYGSKLLLCGNGGSAADCEHIVGELMKGFTSKRPLAPAQQKRLQEAGADFADRLQEALPAISLCGHPALTSAFANDVDATLVFAQQVWGLGREGDALLAISTSGEAENVCRAAIAARAKDIRVVSLTGAAGGRLAELSNCAIRVPAEQTYIVQEYHLPIYHALCRVLEERFFEI